MGTATVSAVHPPSPRPVARGVWRPWLVAWLGAPIIATANGIARRALYEERVGTMPAGYISTGLLLVFLAVYMWLLTRRWPIPTRRTALLIGTTWMALAIVFEFGLGRYVEGESWSKLLAQYDITRGNTWLLIPLWTAIGPAVVRAFRSNRTRTPGAVIA